jgi:hypothetical protein
MRSGSRGFQRAPSSALRSCLTAPFSSAPAGRRGPQIALHRGNKGQGSVSHPLVKLTGRSPPPPRGFEMSLDRIREPEGILRARPVVQYTSRKKTVLAFGPWQPSQIALEARRVREERDA